MVASGLTRNTNTTAYGKRLEIAQFPDWRYHGKHHVPAFFHRYFEVHVYFSQRKPCFSAPLATANLAGDCIEHVYFFGHAKKRRRGPCSEGVNFDTPEHLTATPARIKRDIGLAKCISAVAVQRIDLARK